jgi:hypothetical protein
MPQEFSDEEVSRPPPPKGELSDADVSMPTVTVTARGRIDPLTGLPWQFAGNVPQNDPVGQSTGKPIQEDRAPGIGVQAAGSMATDPEQKRRIIAQQLFPDLGPQAAQARVFYGPNGRMAAVGMDGQPYYVDPDRPDFSALRTFSPANLVSNVGALAAGAACRWWDWGRGGGWPYVACCWASAGCRGRGGR